MGEILTCILCGRRGTQRFVTVAADPHRPEDGHRARCQDRKACQRRIEGARTTSTATQPGDAPSESVAGLAREVEGLRRQMQDFRGLRGQLDDITRVVGELAEQVEAQAAKPRNPVAPSWLAVPGDQVEAVFGELVAWINTVWLRYADAILPECWAWHPDVVEELLWCQHAWHAAYTGPTASVARAGDWHDRYRPGTVRRIRDNHRTCSLENHTDPQAPAAAPLAGLLDPVTAWWAEHRDEAAPAPSEAQFTAVDARRGGGRR